MDQNLDGPPPPMCCGLGISQQLPRNSGFHMGRSEIRMGTAESALQSLIRRAAKVYSAGPAIQDAQAACERLARNGIASTVCYWDVYADQPGSVTHAYVDVLRAVQKSLPI